MSLIEYSDDTHSSFVFTQVYFRKRFSHVIWFILWEKRYTTVSWGKGKGHGMALCMFASSLMWSWSTFRILDQCHEVAGLNTYWYLKSNHSRGATTVCCINGTVQNTKNECCTFPHKRPFPIINMVYHSRNFKYDYMDMQCG